MSNLNILISGSGIAASVFSHWLLRAYPKVNITIVERAPALRLTGASVDIRSSAVDIIKWMGAEQEIRNHTTKEEGVQWVKANGRPIATLRATGRTDIQSITSEFEIFRGTLAKIFIEPLMEKVNLIFDEYIDHFEQKNEKVLVTFSKSKEVKTYDLLIAADGLGSRTRGMMLNTKPQDQVFDEGVHVAYFTIKKDLLHGSRLAKWYNSTGGRVVFLRPDPAGFTRANLMNVTRKENLKAKDALNNAARDGNESYMKLMEESYHDAGWLAPEVLKCMRESDDFYCSLFGQVRSPALQDGRVVLLGDAGYATPGFGTSLAIIGGYVLAGELMSKSGDVKAALKRYEVMMVPFVKDSQGGAAGENAMQLLNPQTQWGIGIRNFILGTVTGLKLDRIGIAVGSALGFSEKKLAMPDYQWPAEEN